MEAEVRSFGMKGAARTGGRMEERGTQDLSREGIFPSSQLGGTSLSDDLTTVNACAWAEIDDVIGRADRFLVMFDDDEGVAASFKVAKGGEESLVIAGMEADGGFVEHVEDSLKVGAELSGQADPLGFSTGEGGGGAVKMEVVEADVM